MSGQGKEQIEQQGGIACLVISSADDLDLKILPGDTDVFVVDSSSLISIVRRCEVFVKVKGFVGFVTLFQVTAVYSSGARSLFGLFYADGVTGELTRKLIEGVLCLFDVNVGSSVDLEDFDVLGMVGSGYRS